VFEHNTVFEGVGLLIVREALLSVAPEPVIVRFLIVGVII